MVIRPRPAVDIALIGAVVAGLCAGAVACSGSGGGDGRKEATAACRAYVSVNGMTGEEGRAAYHRGVSLAAAAAQHDSKWADFASAFRTLSSFSDDLQTLSGNVPAAEEHSGTRAGLAVATQCQTLLPNDPNLNLRPPTPARSG